MCGLNGQYVLDAAKSPDVASVRIALNKLAHRGPEQSDLWVSERAAIGHCRLILSDDAGGRQPMRGARHSILAYNGELYNHHELRSQLSVHGRSFRSRSDTEVVLAAFEHWGNEAWSRLNGMFALALYDEESERLYLARDCLGIKPLFFRRGREHVSFASEPRGLATMHPGLRPSIAGVIHFLRFAQPVSGCTTVYEEIGAVKPGEEIAFDQTGERHRQWFADHDADTPRALDEISTRAHLRYLLNRAVERQCDADAEGGLFLSGGVDSAILLGLMSQNSSERIRTFTVALESDDTELDSAKATALAAKSRHTELRVSCDRFFDAMAELASMRGLPVAFPNEVLIYCLAQTARKDVKFVLTGEGADELFGGYSRVIRSLVNYVASEASSGSYRPLMMRSLKSEYPEADLASLSRFYASITSWWPAAELGQLLTSDFKNDGHVHIESDPFRSIFESARNTSINSIARHVLLYAHLPNLLARLDGATMAASVEGRVPFTDRDLIRFVSSLSQQSSAAFGNDKELLRATFADLLPPLVRNRAKRPFDASLQILFNSKRGMQEIKGMASSECMSTVFNMDRLHMWLDDNRSPFNLQRIWLLVSLNQWLSSNIK